MAHCLTFNRSVTCTVNGNAVESGYELKDGDVIVATSGSSPVYGYEFVCNGSYYSDGTLIDLSNTDIDIQYSHTHGGGAED